MTHKQTLTPSEARALYQSGKLRATNEHGEIEVKDKPKEELSEFKRFHRLANEPISITAAASKYGINRRTLARWVERGMVPVIGHDDTDQRRQLLNEQHVAYHAYVFEKRGGIGRRTFSKTGTPYIPKASAAGG